MKLLLIPILFSIIVTLCFAIGGMLISSLVLDENQTSPDDSTFVPMYFSGKIAEAYQQSDVPSKEICRPDTIQETKDITGTDFKILKLLPEKYKMIRAVDDGFKGSLSLEYSFGPCSENTPRDPYKGGLTVRIGQVTDYLRNDTLTTISGLEGQERIDKLSELRTEKFENRTPTKWTENDRFITINGHLAIIDEPGYTTDRYWDFDSGELLYKTTVTYPGRVYFVDKDFEIYYSIKGYFSANELILMAESID